jgi:hypothetical protein
VGVGGAGVNVGCTVPEGSAGGGGTAVVGLAMPAHPARSAIRIDIESKWMVLQIEFVGDIPVIIPGSQPQPHRSPEGHWESPLENPSFTEDSIEALRRDGSGRKIPPDLWVRR